MTKRTPLETANLLKEIFKENFGGKPSGRYQISRKHLLQLAGYKVFPSLFLDHLIFDGLEVGIVIFDIGAGFAVTELSIFEGYRNVPPAVIEKIIEKKFN